MIHAKWRGVLVTGLATILALALPSTAIAGASQKAEGLWQYTPFLALNVQTIPDGLVRFIPPRSDGPVDISTVFESSTWTGTFNGVSTDIAGSIIHWDTGWWNFFGFVDFEQVTVDGKTGGLFMLVEGSKPDIFAEWRGTWTIVDGTGDLANLVGNGKFWGPGAPGLALTGDIYYDGKIKWAKKPRYQKLYWKFDDDDDDDDEDDDDDD